MSYTHFVKRFLAHFGKKPAKNRRKQFLAFCSCHGNKENWLKFLFFMKMSSVVMLVLMEKKSDSLGKYSEKCVGFETAEKPQIHNGPRQNMTNSALKGS